MPDSSSCRAAILPLAVGVFPFGLVYGVAVASSGFSDLAGALASFLIVAGAAQLVYLVFFSYAFCSSRASRTDHVRGFSV